ncbi:MAG TPA: thiamine pyrophosphate-binding protein [Candidatus Latescibacteria bacterium]|nr:thiamine pyrophosphate-binding protein [Candidatus Latescibacterota bacterium]
MRLTGGQIVAEYLARERVPYFVGIPGHGCLGLVDAFVGRNDVRILQVRAEQAAVHLADGYYRACGRPLACFTSIGPGAMNPAIGLATCYVDSTPCLVFIGDAHTYMSGKGVLQEVERRRDADNLRALEPLAKRCWRVTKIGQLPGILSRAFRTMMSGRLGPVVIALPMDVQAEDTEVDVPGPIGRASSARTAADEGDVGRAAELLASAQRPVILAGGGVNHSEAWEELRKLAERLDAAVITTLPGKGCFPEDHPLAGLLGGSKGTTCGNTLAKNADVLLAVGARFADETTSSYRHGITYNIPPTKLIQVDIDPYEIGKNYPVEVGLVGDAKLVLSQIFEALSDRDIPSKPGYRAEISELRAEWFERLAPFRDPSREPVTISAVLKEVREFLPRDALVVSSSGNAQAQILQEFPFYEPRTNITTGGFSTMGFTLPAALGAKLARPDRHVVGIAGDGDFLMTIHELATAVQYEIPVVVLVLNNTGWQSIDDLQVAAYGEDRRIACDFAKPDGRLTSPDFKAIAEGFGCYAEQVSKATEVKPALKRAFEAGCPAVVEVTVNKEFPYSGGIAVGWWDVPVPTYLRERRAEYERAKIEEVL